MTLSGPARFGLLLSMAAGAALAQDAGAALQRARKAMGDVKSIRYSGTGHLGSVGMNWNTTSPWHMTAVSKYIRTIDYAGGSSTEDITRNQENPPMLGGEAPFVDEIHEGRRVSGKYAWNQPANANPPLPPSVARAVPDMAYERALQIQLTPHGFLKAAAENHAAAQPGEEGGKKVTIVTFRSIG